MPRRRKWSLRPPPPGPRPANKETVSVVFWRPTSPPPLGRPVRQTLTGPTWNVVPSGLNVTITVGQFRPLLATLVGRPRPPLTPLETPNKLAARTDRLDHPSTRRLAVVETPFAPKVAFLTVRQDVEAVVAVTFVATTRSPSPPFVSLDRPSGGETPALFGAPRTPDLTVRLRTAYFFRPLFPLAKESNWAFF